MAVGAGAMVSSVPSVGPLVTANESASPSPSEPVRVIVTGMAGARAAASKARGEAFSEPATSVVLGSTVSV